jgi:tetratricopeptide (TPR) repeat protein
MTTRYDRARVAQLSPVKAALAGLRLPFSQQRKLNGILNALTMQIEEGSDVREVDRLLLEALRTAILNQVDASQATPVLQAIEAFERVEAQRWEQLQSGTLPPVQLTPVEQLEELIYEGEKLLAKRQATAACDQWLAAWDIVKRLAIPGIRSTSDFGKAYSIYPLVFNWCQDLEMELGNAGLDDPVYHEHRVRYAREFLSLFPDDDKLIRLNFGRAEGEALWHLGRRDEADQSGAALVEQFPDEAWAYIGWADKYWVFDTSPKDYARAEAIMRRALERPNLVDRADVLERLNKMYEKSGGRAGQAISPKATATPAVRQLQASLPDAAQRVHPPGRNDPCWCGSGKKYKHCHLAADKARR